jgi:hypothetical protein
MSIDGDEKHSKAPFSTQTIRSAPSTAPFKSKPQVKNSANSTLDWTLASFECVPVQVALSAG